MGQDIARNEIRQVGEKHTGVLRATILSMYSVDIKIYFRLMLLNAVEKIEITDHEQR